MQVKDEAEMIALMRLVAELALPICFRGSGTSLSGQSITDSIMLALTSDWKDLTALIEDVTLPIESLADALVELQQLMQQYNYDDGVIYGHALDGNLHFIFSQGFQIDAEV